MRVAFRCRFARPFGQCRQVQLTHQACNALASCADPSFFKQHMNAWTPIKLSVLQEQLLNFGGETAIFSTMLPFPS
jgi:hypothetical protein